MSDAVQSPLSASASDHVSSGTGTKVCTNAIASANISIAPRLVVKQEERQDSPAIGITTTKEWIVPPRPKPGRKPATDTPPTKRKAQNREAQRSFRERRTARVNELEEQLKKVEADAELRENSYRTQVSRITAENNQLRTTVTDLRREIEALQRMKADSQASVFTSSSYIQSTLTQVASPAPSLDTTTIDALSKENHHEGASQLQAPQSQSLTSHRLNGRESPEIIEIDDDEDEVTFNTRPEGCCGGVRCGKPGGCASFLDSTVSIHHTHKRPVSPDTSVVKRSRFVNNHSELETDFTEVYMSSKKKGKDNEQSTFMSPASDVIMPDSCGFCTDGSLCLCAEMAKSEREAAKQTEDSAVLNASEGRLLPPILDMDPLETLTAVSIGNLQNRPEAVHPPPTAAISGCTGQPGTCQQCQNDPMSTLFCRTLASRMKNSNSVADGACCGGTACGKNGSTAGKDEAKETPKLLRKSSSIRLSGINEDSAIYIPCSAAYQTLSRHKKFEEASADLGQLVGKLNTKGMQVEVSSVRDVLKYLDREFGKSST